MQTYAQFVAKFLINDFVGMLRQENLRAGDKRINTEDIGLMLLAMYEGLITRYIGKVVIKAILRNAKGSSLNESNRLS